MSSTPRKICWLNIPQIWKITSKFSWEQPIHQMFNVFSRKKWPRNLSFGWELWVVPLLHFFFGNTDAQIAPNRSNPQILTRIELKIKPIVHPVTIKLHELPLINKSPFYGKSFGTPPIFSIPIPSDRGRPGHVDSAAEWPWASRWAPSAA